MSFTGPDRRWAAIVLLFALGITLRFFWLDRQSLSMDEVTDLGLARRASVTEIVNAADGFPPLYHLALYALLQLRDRDVMGRALSATLGVLALWPVWRLGFLVAGQRAGLFALALLALSPIHIWFSQEGRAYSLGFLAGAVALLGLWHALADDRWPSWATFVGAALIGLYTHYYFALLVGLAAGLVAWQRWRGAGWRTWRRPLGAFAALGVLALPLLRPLRVDLAVQSAYPEHMTVRFDLPSLGYTYFSFLHGMALGASRSELRLLSAREALLDFGPWILASGVCLAVVLRGLLADRRRLAQALPLALVALAAPPLAGAVSLTAGVHYKPHYVLWAAAPLLLLVALGLDAARPRWLAGGALGVLVGMGLLSVWQRNCVAAHQNEDLRSLASHLAHATEVERPVLVAAGYMLNPVRHHLPGWQPVALPNVLCAGAGLEPALARVERELGRSHEQRAWLVYTRTFHGDRCGVLLDELARAYRLEEAASFPGIRLYQLSRCDCREEE